MVRPASNSNRTHRDSRPRGFSVLPTGPIPTEIGQLVHLKVLDVSRNQLSGSADFVAEHVHTCSYVCILTQAQYRPSWEH